jgi:hypothetical protein
VMVPHGRVPVATPLQAGVGSVSALKRRYTRRQERHEGGCDARAVPSDNSPFAGV